MNEERFVGISEYEDDFRICDRKNNNNLMNMEEILDCLNAQHSIINEQDRIPVKAVEKIINKVFTAYFEQYEHDKMSFAEFAIIKNVLIKIQCEFEQLIKGGEQ